MKQIKRLIILLALAFTLVLASAASTKDLSESIGVAEEPVPTIEEKKATLVRLGMPEEAATVAAAQVPQYVLDQMAAMHGMP